jgi:hypothetical protein
VRSGVEGVEHGLLLGNDGEVVVQLQAVDRDLARAGPHAYAGNRRLPAAGAEVIAADLVFFNCDHEMLTAADG